MKLEVGMYVRTIGGIERLKKENDNGWFFEKSMIIKPDNIEKYIIKASYNIIDLIEKNDYINGSWVNEIVDGKPIHEDYNDPFYSFGWENDDIKTVITHEQMEQIAYKVDE